MKIDFTLNQDTYFLPTAWDEVSYEQYAGIVALQADAELVGTDKAVRIVSVLTGVPLEALEAAGLGLVVPLFNHLDFLQTAPQPDPVAFVTIHDAHYYAQSIETVGELAAFDRVQQAFEGDLTKQMPYLLAILLRKRVKSVEQPVKTNWFQRLLGTKTGEVVVKITHEGFNVSPKWLEKRATLFAKSLNPAQVLGLSAFFLTNDASLPTSTPSFSVPADMVPALNALSASISATATGGWRPSSIWNRMFCATLRCYLWTLKRSLTSSNTSGR